MQTVPSLVRHGLHLQILPGDIKVPKVSCPALCRPAPIAVIQFQSLSPPLGHRHSACVGVSPNPSSEVSDGKTHGSQTSFLFSIRLSHHLGVPITGLVGGILLRQAKPCSNWLGLGYTHGRHLDMHSDSPRPWGLGFTLAGIVVPLLLLKWMQYESLFRLAHATQIQS